jgi:hypothetical protein
MRITFNLYSSAGLESKCTLTSEEFETFRKVAESLKQTVRIVSVGS